MDRKSEEEHVIQECTCSALYGGRRHLEREHSQEDSKKITKEDNEWVGQEMLISYSQKKKKKIPIEMCFIGQMT